jgi:hypothetical protein
MTAPPAPPPAPGRGDSAAELSRFEKLSYVLYVLMSIEVGVFLLVYPWYADGQFWAQNYFVKSVPEWRPVLLSNYFRGAVSGLGVLNLLIGAFHTLALRDVLFARKSRA